MTPVLYGIKSCDTMKKARAWLDEQRIAYTFHDYKTQGIDSATLATWYAQVGWTTLLNRAGTTFRKLSDAEKTELNESRAIALMQGQPSMIKRPVLDRGPEYGANALVVGFKPDLYAAAFDRL